MFKKILVANRGEVALRIIRACKELGIQSVAIYSQADENSLHVTMADEAYCVGPAPSAKSYLNIPAIISVALTSGCDAIHPGYGFLSENADFIDVCDAHHITFIGPSAEAIRKMGDKASAKKTMEENDVPVTKGTGLIDSWEDAVVFANRVGYPVIVKATAGGGGKGMRIASSDDELKEAVSLCESEAEKAFGNKKVYVEKFIQNPKHIEVQIIADKFGNVCHLGERDCSIQRRHQKLLEEAPAYILDENTKNKIRLSAVKAAKAMNYNSVGTVEFLLDSDKNWYFMEMNTRLQVEHCVTEMVTGIDIVKEQISIAADSKLSFSQEDVVIKGHAIECRINAEDSEKNFIPCAGEIKGYVAPGGIGVRVDSHSYTGYSIPPYYDSMIAKLICWGKDRNEAISRMNRALSEYVITGIKTTIPFHQKILSEKKYLDCSYNTGFIEEMIAKNQTD